MMDPLVDASTFCGFVVVVLLVLCVPIERGPPPAVAELKLTWPYFERPAKRIEDW